MVATPQSGLLAQVSSLRLPLGHSGLVFKQCSPHLPAQPPLARGRCRCLRCFSTGGVTVGLVICGVYLFIYFSSLLCCPLCFQGSPQTRQCFLVLEPSLFLRLPSRDGAPSKEGSLLKDRNFQTPGNTLTTESVASLGTTEGNITGRKNK